MLVVSILVFSVVTLVNSYANKQKQSKSEKILASITKVLIIPSLVFICFASGVRISFLVLGALLAYWFGDIALEIPFTGKTAENSRVMLVAGMICFLAGHVLFSILFLGNSLPLAGGNFFLILFALFYLLYGLIIYPLLHARGVMLFSCVLYMLGLSIFSFASLLQLIQGPDLSSLLIFIGSLLFISSDTVLGLREIGGNVSVSSRFIISSYTGALMLIVIGYLLPRY